MAIVGSVVGGVLLDSLRGKFAKQPQTYANPTDEQAAKYAEEWKIASRRNAAINTGIAGAAIAALLVLGVGIARKTPPVVRDSVAIALEERTAADGKSDRSLVRVVQLAGGVLVGMLLGGALVGTGGVLGERYYAYQTESLSAPNMIQAMVMQLSFWVPQAAAVALGSAVILQGQRLVALLSSALCGAVLTSGLVPVLGSLVFLVTLKNTKDRIPPDTLGHCLVMTLAGTVVTALVVWATMRPVARSGS